MEFFAEPRSEEELSELLQVVSKEEIPLRILGTGSNILVSDSGVPGLVIRLSSPEFSNIEINASSASVTAGAGAKLGRVITGAVYQGLSGLESLIGIPGSIGGAVYKNVSASDGDICQWLDSVRVVRYDGQILDFSHDELTYTDGVLALDRSVITSCRFRLLPEESDELTRRLQKIWILRKKDQPIGQQGAGWLFRDPPGASASDLIEEAGLKGTRIGGAVICDRNPNFVLVEPECSFDDVMRLIHLIQTQVRERFGVDLETDLTLW